MTDASAVVGAEVESPPPGHARRARHALAGPDVPEGSLQVLFRRAKSAVADIPLPVEG